MFKSPRIKFGTRNVKDSQKHVKFPRDENKDISCQHCDYKTYAKYLLRRHMRAIHIEIRDIACKQCDYMTSLRQNLKHHIRVAHDTIHDFACKHCKFKANSKFFLRQHEKAVHLKIKDIKCKICDYKTSYSQDLKNHKIKIHGVNVKTKDLPLKECYVKIEPLVCKHCKFKTNSTFFLRQHKKAVHQRMKDFKCKIYDYKTSYSRDLKNHRIKTHGVKVKTKDLPLKECYVKIEPLCYVKIPLLEQVRHKVKDTAARTCRPKGKVKEDSIGAATEAAAKGVDVDKAHGCEDCKFKTNSKYFLRLHEKVAHTKAEVGEELLEYFSIQLALLRPGIQGLPGR